MNPFDTGKYNPDLDTHRITYYSRISASQLHAGFKERLYIHLDMNCFYAQIEQHDYDLRGYPVVVGGYRKPSGIPRGIVATASYEAREYGIKTGMSALEAVKLCPHLLIFRVDYEKYKIVSNDLEEVLDKFCPEVERYSLDEYFLDITYKKDESREVLKAFGNQIKQAIKDKIGLTCSLGISYAKNYAKIASGLEKPDGLTLVLDEEDAKQKLYQLDIDKVLGIGVRNSAKLNRAGIFTIGDAVRKGPAVFQRIFGEYSGKMFYLCAAGKDKGKILDFSEHTPEEVAYGHTFGEKTKEIQEIKAEIIKAISITCYRMRAYNRKAISYYMALVFQDGGGISHKFNTPGYTNLDEYVIDACRDPIIHKLEIALSMGYEIRKIRFSTVDMEAENQQELFFQENDRKKRLQIVQDTLNNHFGDWTVHRATILDHVKQKGHFLQRS